MGIIDSTFAFRKDIDRAVEKVLEKFKQGKMKITQEPDIQIQNIVASSTLNFKVNLDLLAIECENTEYEP